MAHHQKDPSGSNLSQDERRKEGKKHAQERRDEAHIKQNKHKS